MVNAYHTTGRFPQALVLFGPRGTGKTTVARILSKALNCQAPVKGDPCDACSSCLAITEGRSAGVQEMDMASHGSVNDIRELKRGASFALVESWRVYLMDEVHSASREAFDAMLKLIEEPPPKTLFLLVTTEPDQIPETILSRSMPFEFSRIPVTVIEDRLRHIAAAQGIDDRVDPDVYRLLAVRARGGMRNAIMSLEQLSYHDGPIDVPLVKTTFGITDLAQRLLDAAVKGDLARGLSTLREALDSATPPVPLMESLLDSLTALLSAASGLPPSIGAPVSPEWTALHAATPQGQILAAMKTLSDARARMQPGGSSAPSTLAVAYGLLVRDLSPAAFSRAPAGRPISPMSQASPPARNGTQAARHLPPDALKALFASDAPVSVEDARKLLDPPQ